VLVYWSLLWPQRSPVSPYSDIAAFHGGLEELLRRGVAQGVLPLRDTSRATGAMLGEGTFYAPQQIGPLQRAQRVKRKVVAGSMSPTDAS
jgi:hypothetical protein